MTDKGGDDPQTLAGADRDRRMVVTEIVKPNMPKSRLRADDLPRLPLSNANTQGQPSRCTSVSKISRAGDASQIVLGPVLEAGSTTQSSWTCSHGKL